jgi:adenylylsulfate kinase
MNNVVAHNYHITRELRNKKNRHSSFVIWFTGLSGSGKSTLANALENRFFAAGIQTYALDGDNVRKGLNIDLKFTREDRRENIRRIAEVAGLFSDAGLITIAAFISPLKEDRELARKIIGDQDFFEVYIDTPIALCEKRDVKGLYKKARAGEIENFTGISSPYEAPEKADFIIKTDQESVEDAVKRLFDHLKKKYEL